jgi:hypothetical protein
VLQSSALKTSLPNSYACNDLKQFNKSYRCGYKGDTARVKLLYDCEADIEVSDYDFRTVGHLAGAEGHF